MRHMSVGMLADGLITQYLKLETTVPVAINRWIYQRGDITASSAQVVTSTSLFAANARALVNSREMPHVCIVFSTVLHALAINKGS